VHPQAAVLPQAAKRRSRAAPGPLAALFLAAALAPTGAAATVVVMPPLDEMTQRSDVVVHGVVKDTHVERRDGRVVTLTTLEVVEPVKGAKQGELLTVFQVGGTYNGETSWIVGAHRFALHDEVVLFAVHKVPGQTMGEIVPWGIGIGVFEVVRDATGVRAVERIGDVVQAVRGPDGRMTTTVPVPRAPMALGALLTDLRRSAATTLRPLPAGRAPRKPLLPKPLAPNRGDR
jgi:hypothetical protein